MADGTVADWKCDGDTLNLDGVCKSCKEAGWITDAKEIANAIVNDPLLAGKVQIASPVQPEDL